jgi:hypothetical protein
MEVSVMVRPAFLTTRDLARLFQCGPRQVLKMAETGVIPGPIKKANGVNGKRWWRSADIERFLSAGGQKGF